MDAPQDLKDWRAARVKAIERRAEFKACSSGARRLARHMIRSRDSLEGEGMFRGPKKLAKELGAGFSERTVRRRLKELETKGVFAKERRKDPRGTGRRDTTTAYHIRDELLPAALRCASVTDLRDARNGDRPKGSGTPVGRPADTPRRSTSYFTMKKNPFGVLRKEEAPAGLHGVAPQQAAADAKRSGRTRQCSEQDHARLY